MDLKTMFLAAATDVGRACLQMVHFVQFVDINKKIMYRMEATDGHIVLVLTMQKDCLIGDFKDSFGLSFPEKIDFCVEKKKKFFAINEEEKYPDISKIITVPTNLKPTTIEGGIPMQPTVSFDVASRASLMVKKLKVENQASWLYCTESTHPSNSIVAFKEEYNRFDGFVLLAGLGNASEESIQAQLDTYTHIYNSYFLKNQPLSEEETF